MLEVKVHAVRSPYADTLTAYRDQHGRQLVPGSDPDPFDHLLHKLAQRRAEDIESRFSSGEYNNNSVGFVLFDPTAPRSLYPPEKAVLALIEVGPDGRSYLVNGLAKGCEHLSHGTSAGTQVYTQIQRLPDGSFRYGHSAEIEGTIVGVSGLSEIQDRFQAQLLAAEFNYEIAYWRARWLAEHSDIHWYGNDDSPAGHYTRFLAETLPD